MFPRTSLVTLRLTPPQAETVYYELLGLLAHYTDPASPNLDADSETALRLAVSQLNSGLTRVHALGELQLQQLRAITSTAQESA